MQLKQGLESVNGSTLGLAVQMAIYSTIHNLYTG